VSSELSEADDLRSTADVANEQGVSEAEAREWASMNGVAMVGSAYVWTETDVEDFSADLLEDEEDDEDEDDEDLDD